MTWIVIAYVTLYWWVWAGWTDGYGAAGIAGGLCMNVSVWMNFAVHITCFALLCVCYFKGLDAFTCTCTGFPPRLENREKNNGQGKVREFYFGPKVREKSGNFVLNCRLPCKFAVILVDYRECLSRYSPIWKCTCEFKRMFVFFIFFKCYISSIKYNIQISYGMSYFRLRDSSDIFYMWYTCSSTISCR